MPKSDTNNNKIEEVYMQEYKKTYRIDKKRRQPNHNR